MYKYLILLFIFTSCVSFNYQDYVNDQNNSKDRVNYEKFIHFDKNSVVTPLLWGSKSQDDTEILQKALDSGVDKLFIPKCIDPWITAPLTIPSNITIYFQEGVELQAIKGGFLNNNESLLNISSKENVNIYGYGAKFKMWRDDYDSKAYTKGQWRHSISIKSSDNIKIEGLTLVESGGDGVYLGQNSSNLTNNNIILRDLILLNHYRQGISVTSVDGLIIDNVLVSGTKGHLPEAGIDFEPNSKSYGLSNIFITNSSFINNNGAGFLASLQNLNNEKEFVDIYVENSFFHGLFMGLAIMNTHNNPVGEIHFNNVKFKGIKLKKTGENLNVIFND